LAAARPPGYLESDSRITDGGCALLVTSAERARDLRQPPALIRGVGR